MEEKTNAYKVFVGGSEGKRLSGNPRRRREDDNQKGLKEIGREVVDCIQLVRDWDQWRAHVNTVMKLEMRGIC
jgi:hypothetical protein